MYLQMNNHTTEYQQLHDKLQLGLNNSDYPVNPVTNHPCVLRMTLFSDSRRSRRCCREPTLTTLTRPSSIMRSTTPSAFWRRPSTWCPPPLSGSLCPGSTDTNANEAHHPEQSTFEHGAKSLVQSFIRITFQ